MTNFTVINGLNAIFKSLTDDELMALAATVTKQLLKDKLNTRQEAEDAIILHSPNTKSILRRKCITKEILVKYAHENRISLANSITKPELIDTILDFWGPELPPEPNDERSCAGAAHPAALTAEDATVATTKSEVSALADQFSRWFYDQLNSGFPLGAEHFWPDAVLKLNLKSSGNECFAQEVSDGSAEASELLFRTKTDHGLYFNANYSCEGVQGRMDAHGLVIVMACGTLHRDDSCVGIFEQVFGLARDPSSENNWKVKYTYLNLCSKDVVRNVPQLSDGSFASSNMLRHC